LEPLCPEGFSSHRTRENSSHVGIDDRHVIFKCEGKNSSSAIGADARKGQKVRKVVGQRSTKARNDFVSCPMKCHGSTVIAKAFPRSNNLALRSIRACSRGWEHLEETCPRRDHSGDLGLLQHHFGNKNFPGIPSPPPGEISFYTELLGQPGSPAVQYCS